jgi:hypothetical protein
MVFETFCAMELWRQVAWQDNSPRQFHYRERDGREVDVVLERHDGSVIAVEVKTAASASPADFRGLRHARDKIGALRPRRRGAQEQKPLASSWPAAARIAAFEEVEHFTSEAEAKPADPLPLSSGRPTPAHTIRSRAAHAGRPTWVVAA